MKFTISLYIILALNLLLISSVKAENLCAGGFSENTIEGCEIANKIREKNNKPLLKLDAGLTEVAAQYAREMHKTGHFSHVSRNGDTLEDRLLKNGVLYSVAGENLNKGYKSNERAFYNGWMKSPPHKKNLMEPSFRKQGFAVHGKYRVHLFSN